MPRRNYKPYKSNHANYFIAIFELSSLDLIILTCPDHCCHLQSRDWTQDLIISCQELWSVDNVFEHNHNIFNMNIRNLLMILRISPCVMRFRIDRFNFSAPRKLEDQVNE